MVSAIITNPLDEEQVQSTTLEQHECARADKAEVRLERKLQYDFAKLRAKGQLRAMFRTHYAAAVPMTTSPHRASVVDPPAVPITGEKREGSQADPDRGAQKHPRHMGNVARWVYRTPMSF
uniref:Uncharacterized protein n=1 Tax=Hyaloperonospora arabidopsidis (strain Emoy2) TaxID=559515 RepID=M4C0F0_HYAAE